jgi:hypothetical protein
VADDLGQFERWIQLKAAEVNAGVNDALRKTAADLVGRLVRYTPVDTGRARAGWGISLSTPPTGIEPVSLPQLIGGGSRMTSARARKAQQGVITAQRGLVRQPFPARSSRRTSTPRHGTVFGPLGLHSDQEAANIMAMLKQDIAKYAGRGIQGGIYVYNNVPYVVFLNQGHSKQASAHFIERAILEAQVATGKGLTILER